MAGFMKNAMSYLGMSDVVDDEDDYIEEDEEQKPASKSAFDSDHTVTPLASTTAPAASSTTKPFPGGRVNRITTIHPKSYEDAQLVGRALRDGVPVVLNLTGVAEALAYRIVDFSAGVVFGVAVAMGGIGTAIVACIETEAVPLLQVVDVLPGTGSAPERLRELQERYHAPICIDMRGPSAALADRLRLSLDEWGIARYELVDMRAADAVTAPQAFMSALDQHAVNHAPDSDMDREAGLAGKRMSGDAWLWNRAEGVNAPTIEAATLALWGLTHMPDDTPPGVY